MKTQKEIEDLAERALKSLDGTQYAEANPYLYQKIRSRMLHQRQQAISKNARLVLKVTTALILFLGVNITSYYLLNKSQQVHSPHANKTGITAVGEEYFPKDNAYSY